MSNHRKIISILLILFMILQPFKADADPKDNLKMPTKFTVNADISEIPNFDGVIYVYIFDGNGKINVFGLDKNNNFTATYEISLGQAELYKVLINDYKGTELRMEYTTEGDLLAGESSEKNKLTLKLKKGLEEKNDEIQEDDNVEENIQESKEKIKEESIEQEQHQQKEKSREKRRMINFFMDGFLIILVSTIWLYLKYKDKKIEKESGEK